MNKIKNTHRKLQSTPILPVAFFNINLPSMSELETLDPIDIVRGLFIAVFIAMSLLLVLSSYLTIKKIKILNKIVKTPLSIILIVLGVLYLLVCVGTLLIAFTLWIKPLL